MAANVKMGADINSFRQGIQQAKNEVRTLDQEMKKIDATFKATGNAEQAMNQKTEALNKRMEKQREMARQAEQALKAMSDAGIKPTSEAYQRMTREMLAAETGMMETQAALNDLGNNAKKAADNVSSLETGLSGIGKKISLEQVRSGITSITNGLENAARMAVNFGQELWGAMVESAAWADDLNTRASILGLDPDTLQKMDYAAKIVDTDAETIIKAQRKLSYNLQGMGSTYHDVYQVFKDIGSSLDIFKIQQTLNDPRSSMEDKFYAIGEAIHKMSDEEKQNALAQKLFGKSWAELNPLFDMTAEDVEKYGTAYQRYVAIMNDPKATYAGEKQTKNLAELDDKIQLLENNFNAIKNNMLGELAPAFTEVSDKIASMMAEFNTWLESDEGQEKMSELSRAITDLFSAVGDISPESAVQAASDLVGGIKNGLVWLRDNKENAKNWLKTIIDGWAVLKLTGGAADILSLISGLNGLGGGTARAAGKAAGASWGAGFAAAVAAAAPWLVGAYTLLNPSTAGAEGVFTPEEEKRYNAEHWREILGQRWMLEMNKEQEAAEGMAASIRAWMNRDRGGGPELRLEMPGEGTERLMDWWNRRHGSGTHTLGRAEHGGGGGHFLVPVDPVPDVELLQEQLNKTTVHVPAVIDWTANESWAWRVGSGGYIRNIPGGIGTGAVMPSMRANGLPYVPRDNYLALLHEGERVVPATQNRINNYNSSSNLYVERMIMNNGLDAEALASEMAAQSRRTRRGYGN